MNFEIKIEISQERKELFQHEIKSIFSSFLEDFHWSKQKHIFWKVSAFKGTVFHSNKKILCMSFRGVQKKKKNEHSV